LAEPKKNFWASKKLESLVQMAVYVLTEADKKKIRRHSLPHTFLFSKLLSITTQLHCGGHLGRRAQLPDTILEEDHPISHLNLLLRNR
jgi:hypothetical protein